MRCFGRVGIRESKMSRFKTLSLALTLMMLAIQTGSIRALREEGCSVPSGAKVACCTHGTTSSAVVAHVQHQHAFFHFNHLRLGGIVSCGLVDVPCFTTVFAVHNASRGFAIGLNKLYGENQCAVGHGDTTARSLQEEIPFGLFHLRSDVDGFRPSLTPASS